MKKLTGAEAAALRKRARCPDCASTVVVHRRTRTVHVHHSDGCPTARRMDEMGRAVTLVYGDTTPYVGLWG